MKKNTYSGSGSRRRLLPMFAAILALFLLGACAGGNYGTIDRDRDLNYRFLDYEVLPDHSYYVTGGYDLPDAILALHNDYELDNVNNLWVPVPDVTRAQMRKWIDTIAPEQNYRRSNAYFAAYILDPAGKRVGAWYAIDPQTTVKFLDGNILRVYPPDMHRKIDPEKGFKFRGMLMN